MSGNEVTTKSPDQGLKGINKITQDDWNKMSDFRKALYQRKAVDENLSIKQKNQLRALDENPNIGPQLLHSGYIGDENPQDTPSVTNINQFDQAPIELKINRAAARQSLQEKFFNAFLQMGTRYATSFLSSFVGFYTGLGTGLIDVFSDDPKYSNLNVWERLLQGQVEDSFKNKLADVEDYVLEHFPILKTVGEDELPLYQQLLNSNFWADMLSNAGFTGGTIAGIGTDMFLGGKLGGVVKGSKFVNNLFKVASKAPNIIQKPMQFFKWLTLSMKNSTGEATLEAINAMRDNNKLINKNIEIRRNKLLKQLEEERQYAIQNGMSFDQAQQEYANKVANMESSLSQYKDEQSKQSQTLGRNVFLGNEAVLTLTNLISANSLLRGISHLTRNSTLKGLGLSNTAIKQLSKPGVVAVNKEGVELIVDGAVKAGAEKAVTDALAKDELKIVAKNLVKHPYLETAGRSLMIGASEGFEEGAQRMISDTEQIRTTANLNKYLNDNKQLSSILGTYINPASQEEFVDRIEAFKEAWDKSFAKSNSGWVEVLAGAVGGMLGTPLLRTHNSRGERSLGLTWAGGVREAWDQTQGEYKLNEQFANSMNFLLGSNKFGKLLRNTVAQHTAYLSTEEAEKNSQDLQQEISSLQEILFASKTLQNIGLADYYVKALEESANISDDEAANIKSMLVDQYGVPLVDSNVTNDTIKQVWGKAARERASQLKSILEETKKLEEEKWFLKAYPEQYRDLASTELVYKNVLENRLKQRAEEITANIRDLESDNLGGKNEVFIYKKKQQLEEVENLLNTVTEENAKFRQGPNVLINRAKEEERKRDLMLRYRNTKKAIKDYKKAKTLKDFFNVFSNQPEQIAESTLTESIDKADNVTKLRLQKFKDFVRNSKDFSTVIKHIIQNNRKYSNLLASEYNEFTRQLLEDINNKDVDQFPDDLKTIFTDWLGNNLQKAEEKLKEANINAEGVEIKDDDSINQESLNGFKNKEDYIEVVDPNDSSKINIQLLLKGFKKIQAAYDKHFLSKHIKNLKDVQDIFTNTQKLNAVLNASSNQNVSTQSTTAQPAQQNSSNTTTTTTTPATTTTQTQTQSTPQSTRTGRVTMKINKKVKKLFEGTEEEKELGTLKFKYRVQPLKAGWQNNQDSVNAIKQHISKVQNFLSLNLNKPFIKTKQDVQTILSTLIIPDIDNAGLSATVEDIINSLEKEINKILPNINQNNQPANNPPANNQPVTPPTNNPSTNNSVPVQPRNKRNSLFGNYFKKYDNNKLNSHILQENNSAVYRKLKEQGINIQETIDYYLYSLMSLNKGKGPVLHYIGNKNLFDTILLGVEYDEEVKKLLPQSEIEKKTKLIKGDDGNLYLIIGTTGYDGKTADNSLKQGFVTLLEKIREDTKNGSEEWHIHKDQTNSVQSFQPGELISGENNIKQLLDNPITNPKNLKASSLKWVIIMDTKQALIGVDQDDQLLNVQDPQLGQVYVYIPTTSGTYMPVYVKPIFLKEAIKYHSDGIISKDILSELIELFNKLKSDPDNDQTWKEVAAAVRDILVFTSEERQETQIFFNDSTNLQNPKKIVIKDPKENNVFKVLDPTKTDVQVIVDAITDLNPRIAINADQLERNASLYIDKGLIRVQTSFLHTIGANFTINPVDSNGDTVEETYVPVGRTMPESTSVGKSIYVNDKYYTTNDGLVFRDSEGNEVTDVDGTLGIAFRVQSFMRKSKEEQEKDPNIKKIQYKNTTYYLVDDSILVNNPHRGSYNTMSASHFTITKDINILEKVKKAIAKENKPKKKTVPKQSVVATKKTSPENKPKETKNTKLSAEDQQKISNLVAKIQEELTSDTKTLELLDKLNQISNKVGKDLTLDEVAEIVIKANIDTNISVTEILDKYLNCR